MQRQSNRLHQSARSIRHTSILQPNSNDSEQAIKHLHDTRLNFINSADTFNQLDITIANACKHKDLHLERHYIMVIRSQNAYDQRIEDASNAFLRAQNARLFADLQDKSTMHRALRRLFSNSHSTPLTALTRTQPGDNNEPVGSITIDPNEIYNITTAAWQHIYVGNATDQDALVHNFMLTSHNLIYHATSAHNPPRITGPSLREYCLRSRKSAGGLDQW